jgi:hypothetical protein
MFKVWSTIMVVAAMGLLAANWRAEAQQKKQPASPHETVSEEVGGKGGPKVSITYGRPFAKGRKIWGELVPWGKAWRAGADQATTLDTPVGLMVGTTDVPAGKYTLYMVPDEKGTSKMAISKTVGKWGIPVDEKNDLARVDMKKTTLPKQVDQFTIAVTTEAGQPKGEIKMMWETLEFSVPFTVKK